MSLNHLNNQNDETETSECSDFEIEQTPKYRKKNFLKHLSETEDNDSSDMEVSFSFFFFLFLSFSFFSEFLSLKGILLFPTRNETNFFPTHRLSNVFFIFHLFLVIEIILILD